MYFEDWIKVPPMLNNFRGVVLFVIGMYHPTAYNPISDEPDLLTSLTFALKLLLKQR